MKKVSLLATLCLVASVGFAQKKNVSSALSEANAEKPKFGEAINLIDAAMQNPETDKDAKTFYVAGYIQLKQFEAERNKTLLQQQANDAVMYNSLLNMYNYYTKAYDLDQLPDEKGKVKPKFVKKMTADLTGIYPNFINGGVYFNDQKDYKKAYELFNTYTELPNNPMMKDIEWSKDTLMKDIKYYTCLMAVQSEDSKLAISTLERFKNDEYKGNELLQFLCFEYEKQQDTTQLVNTLQEGAKRYPSEPYFIQNLINMYLKTGKMNEAIAYLDEAIKLDPNNANYYNVKGAILEEQKDIQGALAAFQQAEKVDPNNAETYNNIGRVYYNQAVAKDEEVSQIRDNKKYEAEKALLNPMFEKAIPYFQKAHELNPTERSYMIVLRSIYYKLDMTKEYDAMEQELNK
ncbi:MAG: tetratricopeptide repeat protein [Bacteroidales bacterium]